ncbi:MAG: NADH-quinone oxidoreductase subunit [Deltaproteobacteria bacterium]|nr:NADH-quinone oxidoreductase subunit [Deltaproteobacteria bacterium]
MTYHFATIMVFMAFAAVVVFALNIVTWLLSPKAPNDIKASTYESGEIPFGQSWIQFNIRFYVIAIVFLIFDVEVALLFPWAVIFQKLGWLAFVEAFIFIVILLAGLAYLWKEGDLDWVRTLQDAPAKRVAK